MLGPECNSTGLRVNLLKTRVASKNMCAHIFLARLQKAIYVTFMTCRLSVFAYRNNAYRNTLLLLIIIGDPGSSAKFMKFNLSAVVNKRFKTTSSVLSKTREFPIFD